MNAKRMMSVAAAVVMAASSSAALADDLLTYTTPTGSITLDATAGTGSINGTFYDDRGQPANENLTFNFNISALNTAGAPFGAQANSLTGSGVLQLTNISGSTGFSGGVTLSPAAGATATLSLNGGTNNFPYTTPTTTALIDLSGINYTQNGATIAGPELLASDVGFMEATPVAPGTSGTSGGTPVPEEGTAALFALAVAGVMLGRKGRDA